MTLPLISIITPSFNRVSYIGEAIESVLSQSYSNIEYIVVDDGSTDGSWEVLQHYAQAEKIKLLGHPNRENRGQSAALNLALGHARGELIAILDSDDLFAPGKLAYQAEYLFRHKEVGMVYGQGMAIDAYGKELYPLPPNSHKEAGDPNGLLLDCYMALPGGALVRKSIYEQVGGFEESFRAGQDHDMVLRIAEAAPFAYQSRTVFYYRKHADSISQNGVEKRWRAAFEILRRASQRYPYRASTLRKRSALINFRMGQVFINKKSYPRALYHFIKSGLLDPFRALNVVCGREKIK